MTQTPTSTADDLDAFRLGVRAWLAENMPVLDPTREWDPIQDDDVRAGRARELQRRLWDGGLAGICYPREYGGRGLPVEFQRAFDDEAIGYELPYVFSMPTSSICGPIILEFGTEEQKQRYIPAFLRGDEIWVQLLSEPSGGSDLAGALTRADRDGDTIRLTGSKIWSSGARKADLGLCLARTNWDVPKHRGLTMFIVPLTATGVTVREIITVDGTDDFCEEFLDDVELGLEHVVGQLDDGWSVASRMLFHERTAMGGSSPYLSVVRKNGVDHDELVELVAATGGLDDERARWLIGDAEVQTIVQRQLVQHIGAAISDGSMPDSSGALLRLMAGLTAVRRATIGLDLAGDAALAWADGDPAGRIGIQYLMRQARCISGGTVEMQRNIISERLLGMPREYAADREVPFRQVRTNRAR